MRRGGVEAAVHFVEQDRPLNRALRGFGDRLNELVLSLAQDPMPEAVPLLNYAAHALARAAHGLREVERRRSDGEARGGEAEVAGGQPVGEPGGWRPARARGRTVWRGNPP